MGPSPRASLESILHEDHTRPRVTQTGSCYLFACVSKWPDFPKCSAHGGMCGSPLWEWGHAVSQDPQFGFRSPSSWAPLFMTTATQNRQEFLIFFIFPWHQHREASFTLSFTLYCQNKVKRRPTRRPVPICAGFLHNCTPVPSKVDVGQVRKNVPGP